MKSPRLRHFLLAVVVASAGLFISFTAGRSQTQDWLETGINRGAPMIKLAVTQFPATSTDPKLTSLAQEFNQVLWDDLDNAGIFQMISRSLYPLKTPVEPGDVEFKNWTDAGIQMLVFGKTEVLNGNMVVTGRLYDVQNPANPSVLAKRYVATMNEVSTRESAHRFLSLIHI